jgi:hypothetical protein
VKVIEIHCSECGKKFEKGLSEHKRKLKRGYEKFFCSRKCFHDSTMDEFSPFRQTYYLAKAGARVKKLEFNLTLPFLKGLWEKQNGLCPYSGLKMELPSKLRDTASSPKQASIDRIDPKKGYTQDNVEYVMLFVNLGKNGFAREQIKDLFKEF